MRIIISGSSGLIGSALVSSLESKGHEVVRLVREGSGMEHREPTASWHPNAGTVEEKGLEGAEAVVHLAGENVAEGRWTERKKALIRDSRVNGTCVLSKALAELQDPPRVLVSASAIGYYGDRGDEVLTEKSPAGEGFLAEVSKEWEAATAPAEDKGIRVVHLRTGIVLSAKGGALQKMLKPFRLGLGGPIGSGKQYMSPISLADEVGVIERAIEDEELRGPVNAVMPEPVTNLEFTKTLAKVLRRPAVLPVPSFVLKLAFGEMADEMLLVSARVEPRVLEDRGHEFRHADLESALRDALKT